MMEQQCSSVDKLSKAVRHMQKCLECPICLRFISKPVKTRCGHSFCRGCITKPIRDKRGCPVCKADLQRRNVSSDDEMELYINRLQKLITAIRMDTGINILSHSVKPHDTRESSTSNVNDYKRPSVEGNVRGKQDSSSTNSSVKSLAQSQSEILANKVEGSSVARRDKVLPHRKTKKYHSETLDKKEHVTISNLSGSKPLSIDDSHDSDDGNNAGNKVLSWLKDMPNNDTLADPNAKAPIDCIPDDTAIPSTSKMSVDPLVDKLTRHGGPSDRRQQSENNDDDGTYRTTKGVSSQNLSRDENNTSGKKKGVKTRRSLETKPVDSTTTNLKFKGVNARVRELDNQKAGTSNTTKPDAENKDRYSTCSGSVHNLETSDVEKASSSNMLPSAKKNWSSVVQFGKEMRTKKRKLKSLSVSIESRNKTRLSDESTEEGVVKSRLSDDTTKQRNEDNSIENKSNTSESNANRPVDKRRFEKNTSLPNIESTRRNLRNTGETSAAKTSPSKGDGSPSKGHRGAANTSFLTLEEGEQVHIRNLNNDQLEDIIGISAVGESRILERNTLPLKKRGNLSLDRSLNSPQVTPVKSAHGETEGPNVTGRTCHNYNDTSFPSSSETSPAETRRMRKLSEIFAPEHFRSPVLTETPIHGRLSLKYKGGSTGRKSKGSSTSGDTSRLMAVTRDLTEEIGRTKEKTIDNGNALNSPRTIPDGPEENNGQENLPAVSGVSTGPSTSSEITKARNKQQSRCFVAFKKLGKVFKQLKRRPVKFIYLGPTRRVRKENFIKYDSLINLQKPCNPIELVTAGITVTSGNNLPANEKNHSHGTVETKSVTRADNISRYAEPICINPTQRGSSFNEPTGIKHNEDNVRERINPTCHTPADKTQDSIEVVFVSMENQEGTQLPKKGSPRKNPGAESNEHCTKKLLSWQKSSAMNGIKLLSPDKDSQLKFLSTESPLVEAVHRSKLAQRAEVSKDHSPTKKGSILPDVKGTYSKALIRKSQEATSESSGPNTFGVANSRRKRKRSNTRENLSRRMKRMSRSNEEDSMEDEESDSDRSFCSKATTRLNSSNKGRMPKAKDNQLESTKLDASKELRTRESLSDDPDTQDMEVVTLSSSFDTVQENTADATKRPKKSFKRIITQCSSDTDSTDVITAVRNVQPGTNAPDKQGPTVSKRTRFSLDPDEADAAAAILDQWGKEVEMLEIGQGKGNVKQTTAGNSKHTFQGRRNDNSLKSSNPSRLNSANVLETLPMSRDTSTAGDLFASEMAIVNERRGSEARSNMISEGIETFSDKDSLEFNEIIDKVRKVQRLGSNSSGDNNRKEPGVKENVEKEPSLMHDNFDEIIANVDTEALMDELVRKERTSEKDECNRKRRSDEQLAQKASPELSDKIEYVNLSGVFKSYSENTSVPHHSNNSDKENNAKYKKGKRFNDTRQRESDGDKTLTPECFITNDKSPAKKESTKYNRSFSKTKSSESGSNKHTLKEDNVLQRSSAPNSARPSPDIDETMTYKAASNNHESTPKESSDDPDSLTNITHHQLMLQQFEEDLFGICPGAENAPNIPSENNTSSDGQRTPRKGTKMSVERRNVQVMDTECSGEEDSIIQNTPDVKTKTGEEVISVTGRNSTTPTATSESIRTHSPVSAKKLNSNNNSTPTCKRRIYPFYHSTPIATSTTSRTATKYHVGSTTSTETVEVEGAANTLQESNRRKLCFVCSGLTLAEVDVVKKFAQSHNAKYVSQFDKEVTHVIVKTDEENNGANKTLKYLQGIAHRKWIVGYKWVVDSLDKLKLMNEEPYEAVDSSTLEAGPRNSRLRQKDLFKGFAFLCIGPYADVSVDQYKDLLRFTGATVVESLEALAVIKDELKVIVIQSDTYDYEVIGWYQKTRAVPIVHDWIVTCISQYKLVSCAPFLQELSRQQVLALGFPPFLVEEDPDEESDVTSDE